MLVTRLGVYPAVFGPSSKTEPRLRQASVNATLHSTRRPRNPCNEARDEQQLRSLREESGIPEAPLGM